jgi:hypothetical protein
MHPGAEIASLTRYGSERMVDIALAGGNLYLTVMRAMLEGFIGMGCVSTDAHIVEINGPIGRMRQTALGEAGRRSLRKAARPVSDAATTPTPST